MAYHGPLSIGEIGIQWGKRKAYLKKGVWWVGEKAGILRAFHHDKIRVPIYLKNKVENEDSEGLGGTNNF